VFFFQETIYFTLERKKVEFIVVYREYERCSLSILREKKLFYVVIICSFSALIWSVFTLFVSYFFPVVFFIDLADI